MSHRRTLSVFNLTKKHLYEYDTVWKWQKALQAQVHKNRTRQNNGNDAESMWFNGDALILCEHPVTYTLGKSAVYSGPPESSRNSSYGDILNSISVVNLCQKTLRDDLGDRMTDQDTLRYKTVAMRKIERGGDITLHAPGQLVIYPILDLSKPKPEEEKFTGDVLTTVTTGSKFKPEDLRWYVTALEQALIETVNHFVLTPAEQQQIRAATSGGGSGVPVLGGRRCSINQGVWLQNPPPKTSTSNSTSTGASNGSSNQEPTFSKIGAIGISASRWICMHGASLNVTFDEEFIQQHYHDRIVPCGMSDPHYSGVTSVRLAAATAGAARRVQDGSSQDNVGTGVSPTLFPSVSAAADTFLQKFLEELGYTADNVMVYTDCDDGDMNSSRVNDIGRRSNRDKGGRAVQLLDELVTVCVRDLDRIN